MIDMENMTWLVVAGQKMADLTSGRTTLSAGARSSAREALGIEIEERALQVVVDARRIRGYDFDEDDAAALVPEEVVATPEETEEAPPAFDGPFNAAKVRDFMVLYGGGFLIPELHAAVGGDLKAVKNYVAIWARDGKLEKTGFKMGRHEQYRYIPPVATTKVKPRTPPPERSTPGVGADRRADGAAVERSALARANRKQRSTPGQRSRLTRTDAARERVEAARAERESRRKK